MTKRRPARLAAALAIGLAAGGATWARVATIEPSTEIISVRRYARTPNYDVWSITLKVRGGETIEEIRIEPVSGPIHIVGQPYVRGVNAGWTKEFRVQLDDPATSQGAVRILQKGRIERTYDVPLEERR